jgi:hypothetical protein
MVSKDRTQEPNFDGLRLTMIAGLIEPYARCERPCARRRKAPLRSPCRTIRNNRRLKKLDSWIASIRHPLNQRLLLGVIIRFNDAGVPIHDVCFEERSFSFPGPCQIRISQTWMETSAWGDRFRDVGRVLGLGRFLRPQKFLHEKTNSRRDT